MNCIQKQQLVSFPKVRIWKPWFRHFNNHKEFRNEGTVHLFSLMALFSYANFRSNERMISGERYMEAPGQWIEDFRNFATHRVINAAEAAEILGCSRQNIIDLTKRGKLHPIKTSEKSTLYLKSEVLKRNWQ